MVALLFLLVLMLLVAFFTWTDTHYGYGLSRFRRSSSMRGERDLSGPARES